MTNPQTKPLLLAAPAAAKFSPPPARLRGVRFKSPVTKITTVDSPIRPRRSP